MKIEIEKEDAIWIRNRLYDFADWIGVTDDNKKKILCHVCKLDKAIQRTINDNKSSK